MMDRLLATIVIAVPVAALVAIILVKGNLPP